MKKVIAALMLCIAGTCNVQAGLTSKELVTWCENESDTVQKIAEYKSSGYTQREVNAMIIDGKFDLRNTRAEPWTKWLVAMTKIVYNDELLKMPPKEWREVAYSTCIERLTEKK